MEVCERFGDKMQALTGGEELERLLMLNQFQLQVTCQKKSEMQMAGMAQIAMQRIVTEWLRNDALWEASWKYREQGTAERRFQWV